MGRRNIRQTWEEWRAAGKKLKAKGHPFGQTLAHAFGDANAFWYPYLWSWGGKEVEADGKTVVLNSTETVESVEFAVGFWKDACDEGAFAWDDSGNNRAFLAGTISATNNGASIYIEAKKKPDSYQTQDGKPLKDDMLPHADAQGAGRPVQLACAVRRHGHGLRQKPEGREGFLALDSHREDLRAMVGHRSRASRSVRPRCGRTTRCGRKTRSCPRSAPRPKAGTSPAMPGRPTARPPR